MDQVIVLSLIASLNPALIAATTVMLLLDKPTRVMTGYLLGAHMTSITLGLVIGFSPSNANLVVLWLLAVALASFVVAPSWTPRAKRSSQGLGRPPRPRVRNQRICRDQRTALHQAHRRAGQLMWLASHNP